MTLNEIQRLKDKTEYWDMLVKEVECNYFADEAHIIFDDSEGNMVNFEFFWCYKSAFNHVLGYAKSIPIKEMSHTQIPYYMQDVKVSEIVEEGNHLWVCKINMFPLHLEVWCKEIRIK